MLGKLFKKPTTPPSSQHTPMERIPGNVTFRVSAHYGIPSTASNLAFDAIQCLVAVGTLDGRIKVIGGNNIEGLLMSPKSVPFKHLEFLQNQGFLVSVSNENEIQVWDLEKRCISSNLLWESNITAFSLIYGTQFMFVGDEYGFLSVLKFDAEEGKIHQLPYHIPANLVAEMAEISFSYNQSIVGVLPQPSSTGNRVLVAYENGLIILWDIIEDRAILVRGCKDLELKDEMLTGNLNDEGHGHGDDLLDHEQEGKEISSLCWVSSDGSIIAVGYVDGDILLWNLSVSDSRKDERMQKALNKVVKLQLSSGERRLPVIVLHWSPNTTRNDCRGQLFVYGGEEIGAEEVLTILDLDWSSGIATLKCVSRLDLPLSGSFADMIVMRTHDLEQKGAASLLILTNPGQLLFYDNACLSSLMSEPDKKHSVFAVQYPATVPTIEPYLTVAKLHSLGRSSEKFVALGEMVPALKKAQTKRTESWPLTGGVPYQPSSAEDIGIKRIYVAGYKDGTVRLWDATCPVLRLIFVFKVEVKDIEIAGLDASISALEFSSCSSTLAIGNELGLVCLYSLDENNEETSLTWVTETQREVHRLPNQTGPKCTAIFSVSSSPVCCLHWVSPGYRLAAGFEAGQVAMLETSSASVLFLTDVVSGSPVISIAVKTLSDADGNCEHQSDTEKTNECFKEVAVILTRDSHIVLMDSATGQRIHEPMHPKEGSAIALCLLEENASVAEGSEEPLPMSSQDVEGKNEPLGEKHQRGKDTVAGHAQPKFMDTTILLCCENMLRLYSLKSLIQGSLKVISKLNLLKPCAWATVCKQVTLEDALLIVYQSGEIEIRSLPEFAAIGSTSLIYLLRWNAKTNMEKKMSSEKGLMTLVNGSEFAIISLSAFENDFRIPEAFACLHDKVLAAAADASLNSRCQKNKQNVFDGIIKGLKGTKKDMHDLDAGRHVIAHLDSIFSRFPFSDPLKNLESDLGVGTLNIDDIDIDEPASAPSSSVTAKDDGKGKETNREKLFEGGSTDSKPRVRTREEIIAKYRKTGDPTSAAAEAKDKLLERGEKLERLSRRTEELQSGAETFAELANELAKTMEKRSKWWKI